MLYAPKEQIYFTHQIELAQEPTHKSVALVRQRYKLLFPRTNNHFVVGHIVQVLASIYSLYTQWIVISVENNTKSSPNLFTYSKFRFSFLDFTYSLHSLQIIHSKVAVRLIEHICIPQVRNPFAAAITRIVIEKVHLHNITNYLHYTEELNLQSRNTLKHNNGLATYTSIRRAYTMVASAGAALIQQTCVFGTVAGTTIPLQSCRGDYSSSRRRSAIRTLSWVQVFSKQQYGIHYLLTVFAPSNRKILPNVHSLVLVLKCYARTPSIDLSRASIDGQHGSPRATKSRDSLFSATTCALLTTDDDRLFAVHRHGALLWVVKDCIYIPPPI